MKHILHYLHWKFSKWNLTAVLYFTGLASMVTSALTNTIFFGYLGLSMFAMIALRFLWQLEKESYRRFLAEQEQVVEILKETKE